MDNLIKQLIEKTRETEKIKSEILILMKEKNLKRIDLPDGSYIRLQTKQIQELIAWCGRDKELAEKTAE